MSDRPILFSGPMVRAILDGRKTQTRRVAKRQDIFLRNCRPFVPTGVNSEAEFTKPGWSKGDRLWVRETWAVGACAEGLSPSMLHPGTWLRDNGGCWYAAGGDPTTPISTRGKWRPGIHMPRWASRLTLTVTDVRVQQLQEIRDADAIAEGATLRPNCYGFRSMHDGWSMDWSKIGRPSRFAVSGKLGAEDISLATARTAFGSYWNEIHGGPNWNLKPSAPWDDNPWVVAVTFTAEQRNIDAVARREVEAVA